jgi:signal transduction histidine kinase
MEGELNGEKHFRKPEIKILAVDDREDNLFSIETILDRDGYTIVKANSGKQALKILLKDIDFTLILMDVQMPDINGFETATMIYERERLRHIPIIFITANDYGEENIFKGYQMGGVDYIYKPINPELLRAKVGVFVELYKKTHQLVMQEQNLINVNKHLEKEIQERIISEEKVMLLNRQLLENIQQLRSTNEELDRFAYIASHDLQEPLRKIRTFGDRLSTKLDTDLPEDAQHYLKSMLNASERMQSLINDILTYSRFTTMPQAFEDVNLETIVKEVLSDLEVVIEQRKAHVTWNDLPTVPAIPGQIRQLFQNLISNALKFAKEDTAPVIEISAVKSKGKFLRDVPKGKENEYFSNIYFKDNGIGFDPKFADQIFVLFKRLHNYNRYAGTGIGLSICKKIVERHNGIIAAESKPNHGAVFTVSLPYVQDAQASRQVIEQSSQLHEMNAKA